MTNDLFLVFGESLERFTLFLRHRCPGGITNPFKNHLQYRTILKEDYERQKQGGIGGRRRKLKVKKRLEIVESVLSGRKSAAEMTRLYEVSQPTVSRIIAEHRQRTGKDHACQP